jgi:hypothetical protein
VTIQKIHDNPLGGMQYGRGLVVAAGSATVNQCVFGEVQKAGIQFDSSGSLTVSGSSFTSTTHSHERSEAAANAIVIKNAGNSAVTISNTKITGFQYIDDPATSSDGYENEWTSAAIIASNSDKVTITGLEVSGTDVGLDISSSKATISNSKLATKYGAVVNSGELAIDKNTVITATSGEAIVSYGGTISKSVTLVANTVGKIDLSKLEIAVGQAVASSVPSVATGAVANGVLTITAISPGDAVLTVNYGSASTKKIEVKVHVDAPVTTTSATTPTPSDPVADLVKGDYKTASEILALRDGLNAIGPESLKAKLNADPSLWSKLAAFEKAYAAQADASVIVTAAQGVDSKIIPSQITLAGALLSAGQGENLELRFQPVATKTPFDYQNVQVDIDLYYAGTQNKVALKVPVRVTMPIPGGLQENGLGIRHYFNNNLSTYEEIVPAAAGGHVAFTVSRFSPFVFYNRNNAAGTGTGNNQWNGSQLWYAYNPLGAAILQADPDAYSPKTGDNSMAPLYGLMAAASLMIAIAIARKGSKASQR